jgi:predicted CXXCH cytochrome family protein
MRGPRWMQLAALAGVLVIGRAAAQVAPAAPDRIADSKHNFQLATNPVHVAPGAGAEDGLCVFCHTPHKGASSLLLWNHQFSTANYTWKDVEAGKTTGGTAYPTNLQAWAGSTRKCLSCHDGTVSVGSLYWSNATGPVQVNMQGPDQTGGVLSNPSYIIPKAGDASDLSGNHPVGVPYSFGQAVSTYNQITTGPDVRLAQWVAVPTGVKIFGAGGGGAPLVGAAGIECASCHDPHGTGNTFFLRVTKSGSQLCLACHIK